MSAAPHFNLKPGVIQKEQEVKITMVELSSKDASIVINAVLARTLTPEARFKLLEPATLEAQQVGRYIIDPTAEVNVRDEIKETAVMYCRMLGLST